MCATLFQEVIFHARANSYPPNAFRFWLSVRPSVHDHILRSL